MQNQMDALMKILTVLISAFALMTLTSCEKDGCSEKNIPNCLATLELNPVCGCNGKTYGNPSIAECSGIEEYRLGACE